MRTALPELTIFTALAGRERCWRPFTRFLTEQAWPHERVQLILLDTSQSEAFSAEVRDWLCACDYPDVRYLQRRVGRAGLADIRRVGRDRSVDLELDSEVHCAMCRIYSAMSEMTHTDLLWTIEDDVIPPPQAGEQLYRSLSAETISVSGVYDARYQPGKIVAWSADDALLSAGAGVQEVKGNGFGCLLVRAAVIKQHVFCPDPLWPSFDRAFYHRLEPRCVRKIDWSVRCQHLSPTYAVESCPHPYEGAITAQNFCEEFYLAAYPDVQAAISNGCFSSGFEHYELCGEAEGRAARPNDPFDEEYYLRLYPDVAEAVRGGAYENGCQHYLLAGRKEGRFSRVKQQLDAPDSCVTAPK